MNYFITLDMAKELAMVERNEKGKQARRYFIDCEKQLHEQKHLPVANADTATLETGFQEKEKYQVLNDMIKSMKLDSTPVVIPSIEMVNIIHAIRTFLVK
ncbi:hypothetical protein A8139_17585 [Marinomonas primoryensis]|uniref:Uncharacterized protein n=1 Tax=Marinomonas primoryensis TaxID=178399 RepID=A0A2Z4PVD4_9GAMM|nr:antA/AntB antirepressor family protein [Marinomonas primoryensis]AWY01572.1 hypothetical protein A8139_17585 [Marinomonas primoryensis]